MDLMVDDIITGVKGLKKKVQTINEHQDRVNELTKKANKKAGQVENRIKRDNEKLK
jgi:hypothetical protein